MDSFTHLFIGGAIAAAIAPAGHRRAAILAGAALNTLPDLDVLPLLLSDDPIVRMTWHRAATHSLLVLPLVALALWAWFRSRGGRVAQAPRAWFWIFQACLLSHPLFDAFTIYGTQLFWPLPVPPTMWSSVFIIDPLITLPLVLGCVVAAWLGARPGAKRAVVASLAFVGVYLGWSLVAKSIVEREAERSLAAIGLADAPRFTVPMPFNTLLWRVVAMTPDGFVEGERSIVADRGPIRFTHHPSDIEALDAVRGQPQVARLLWFNHHFTKAQVRDGQLVLTDLRMGAEPDYSFRFAVAEHDGEGWRPIPARQLEWPWEASRRLGAMWTRIWHAPADPGL
ncbi:metal-dependent hydrolase [Lysobacter sp. A6]|uniref:Metal-dependent hydrolase n=1 Tax=Noviluteimonas lactosilytica TaxID=2888523 RepID=A0ABS8JKA5_9GAMM|nr:metal-dependent hydrolase [Lysobacter lactosilyticus]MCC8364040.1 metal-dependent hydrolase [Lysobacter lactosilyticus]